MALIKNGKHKKNNKSISDIHESDDEEVDLHDSIREGGIQFEDIYIPPAPERFCGSVSNNNRLIITKIINHFFKSYGKTKVIGPLHKCFNAVVGPNGSGKSNVIDAMLFVFGYRASKIRSKKLSSLIHKSERFPNVQSCSVSVHFAVVKDITDDDDAYEIIPNTEFSITRTAFADNSSYYQIDNRRVQFKEVATLLRNYGVDLDHNRFLILQGEVEQIALMKPKSENEHDTGLLEYLEDIIGTSRLKKPLVQLQEKEEVLTEKKLEKLNRLQLVDNQLKELEKPMQEAVGFLKIENSITNSKNQIYQKNIQEIELKIEEVQTMKEFEEKSCSELIEKLNNFQKIKDDKVEVLNNEAKKYENLKDRLELLEDTFKKASNKDVQLQADMQQINMKRKKNLELLEQEKKKLVGYETLPKKNLKEIKECEVLELKLGENKEILEKEKLQVLSTLQAQTQELQDKKEVLQNELVKLNKLVADKKEPYALAESELKIYLSKEESEEKKYNNLKEDYENNSKLLKERSETVANLMKAIPDKEKSLHDMSEQLNQIKLRETKLAKEVKLGRTQVEESKSSMQASRSRGKVIDSLVQKKREGECPGLFGRLGDLGAINAKYDVAISTACGPLDNIVVDTVETAQWCIEFLKKYDIGRATFIALDKQEHLKDRANGKIKTPENVERLYDLIQVEDERVKTAFYYALRDTLVALDLEQATRIAYGSTRFRVVTLQGDVIETSGTMSGGGRKMSGRMGRSINKTVDVDPKKIQAMESELIKNEKEIVNLREKQMSLENKIQQLEPELRQMKINLEKFSLELKSLQELKPTLEKQLKMQEKCAKLAKADEKQVKLLTNSVNEKKKEYEKAFAIANEVQIKVDTLTKEIKSKTTDKMKAMDKKIKDVVGQIDKCRNELVRLRVAIKTAERNAKKSKDHIANIEREIVKAEESLEEMKAQRKEIEDDASQLIKAIEEINKQLSQGQEEYVELKKEVSHLTKEENKLKADKIEIDQKIKTLSKELTGKQAEIHNWRLKINQLQLQDIHNEAVEPLKTLTREELDSIDFEFVKKELHAMENELKSSKPNLKAIEEYYKLRNVFLERAKDLEDVSKKHSEVRDMIELIKLKRKDEFLAGFSAIRYKLKEMYQMITLGGDADIDMVDSFDPFTEGIQFNVRPPKKAWKMITNLSGGEKTLSSLALVFALHYYKPSPLYVMDEIDAALDFKNVSIIGYYIKERTKNAQFLIISLRPNMYDLSQNLIGIFKTHHTTKSVIIDPRQQIFDIHKLEKKEKMNELKTEEINDDNKEDM